MLHHLTKQRVETNSRPLEFHYGELARVMAEQSEEGGEKRDRRKESRVIYKGKHDEKTGREGYSGCVRMCVHVFVKQERKQRQRDREGEALQSYLVWHWLCEYESCCP